MKRSGTRVMAAALGAAWLSWAGAARAVEVSLEENKAERGSIFYVDMQLVFRLYPETLKAKQNFEEVVRQAEEQVNLRKAELIGLRAEIARLRAERELLALSPIPATPAPAPAAEPRTASTATVSVSTAPAPLVINLPGEAEEPGSSAAPPAPSTAPAALPPASGLAELDRSIEERSRTIETKEAEFKAYQAQVEKNLLELEGRRSEILLGKIYRAIQAVARETGVSVVVDKSQILFGHKSVDLTEKVLAKLKEP